MVGHLPRGTKHLNLAHCGLSGKGVNPMATAMVTNKLSLNSLTYLNLAGNVIKVGFSAEEASKPCRNNEIVIVSVMIPCQF